MNDTAIARTAVDRFIDAIELTAAGFLAAVTAITFVSVFLRYIFSWSIPDAYDMGALLLGTLIFWGMAGACYRGDHISVDLLWSVTPRRLQRAMDIFADLVTFGSMTIFCWMMAIKVVTTQSDHVLTFDLRQPVWIYYLLAWLGLAAAVALSGIRVVRLVAAPHLLARKTPAEMVE